MMGRLLLFPPHSSDLPCDCIPKGRGLWLGTLKRFAVSKDSRGTLEHASLTDSYNQESSRPTQLSHTPPISSCHTHPVPVSLMRLGFIHTREPGTSEFYSWCQRAGQTQLILPSGPSWCLAPGWAMSTLPHRGTEKGNRLLFTSPTQDIVPGRGKVEAAGIWSKV